MKHKPRHQFQPRPKCGDKNCYPTEKEAQRTALEQELLSPEQETKIDIYRCQYCGQYHLTSKK